MAHELDFSTGAPAFAAYKKKAWHGLGTVVAEPMSVEEALHLGRLDFEVRKAPNIHLVPEGPGRDEQLLTSGDSYFTYRTDTGAVLGGRLGKSYEVLQNAAALAMTDEIVSTGEAHIETVGALRGGRQVFVTLKLEGTLLNGDDPVESYCLITNSHDGRSALAALFTNVRVVCANTLRLALGARYERYAIRHTSGAHDRLQEALAVLGIARHNRQAYAENAGRLRETRFTPEQFNDYVLGVFTSKAEREAIRSGHPILEVLSHKKVKAVRQVVQYAAEGPGQQQDVGTAWWAYNAVTGYLANVKGYADDAHRMESLLMSTSHEKIGQALALAQKPSLIESLRRPGSGIDKLELILN